MEQIRFPAKIRIVATMISDYKAYHGPNIEEMPQVIAEGRIPLNLEQIMRIRLEVLSQDDAALHEEWWGNFVDSGDGVFVKPNGYVKFVYDAPPIRQSHPASPLTDYGALILSNNEYDRLEGLELSPSEIELYATQELLTVEEAKANPIWRFLARDDQHLLETYVDATFSLSRSKWGFERIMNIFTDAPIEFVTGRLCCIGALYDASDLCGVNILDSETGNIVAVRPPL